MLAVTGARSVCVSVAAHARVGSGRLRSGICPPAALHQPAYTCRSTSHNLQFRRLGTQHPGIVVAHHPQVSADGNILLPLELAESDLLDVMESSTTRSFGDGMIIRTWMRQVLSALAFSHSRGVAHRDVKPENILLVAPTPSAASNGAQPHTDAQRSLASTTASQGTETGDFQDGATWLPQAKGLQRWKGHNAKLCDFGSALIVPAGSTAAAAHGAVGSSLYAAPEVFQLHLTGSDPPSAASLWPGFRESLRAAQEKAKAAGSSGPMRYCGFRADVWSFGITLYVSVVGRPPFKAACPLDAEFRAFVRATQPKETRTLPVLAPEHEVWQSPCSGWDWPIAVGPQLRALLLRCLQCDPARRCSLDDATRDPWFEVAGAGSSNAQLPTQPSVGAVHPPLGMFDPSGPLQPGASGGRPADSQLPSGGLRTNAVGRTWLETHGARDAAAHSLVLSEASASSDAGSGRNSFVEEMLEGGKGGEGGDWGSSTQLDAYLAQAGIAAGLQAGEGGDSAPWAAGFSSDQPGTIRASSHSSAMAVSSKPPPGVANGFHTGSAAAGAWGGGFASGGSAADAVAPFDPAQYVTHVPGANGHAYGGSRNGSWLEEGASGGAGFGFGVPSADAEDAGSVMSGFSERHGGARGRASSRGGEAHSRQRSGSQKRRREEDEEGGEGGGVFGAAAAAAASIASRTPDEGGLLPQRESLRTHSGGSVRSLASEDGSKRRLVRDPAGGAGGASPPDEGAPLSPMPGQGGGTEYSTGSGSSTEARRAAVMSFLRGER